MPRSERTTTDPTRYRFPMNDAPWARIRVDPQPNGEHRLHTSRIPHAPPAVFPDADTLTAVLRALTDRLDANGDPATARFLTDHLPADRWHWHAGVLRGERDREAWPDDPIGDRLWRSACEGDLLTVEREVTFTIDFPTVTSCATFVAELDDLLPERVPDRAVEQTLDITVLVIPTHAELSDLDAMLSELAEDHLAEFMGFDFVPVYVDV